MKTRFSKTSIGRDKLSKSNAVSNRAIKRLLRDMNQIINEPVHGVSALPINTNIFVWHGNILGLKGTLWEHAILHIELYFPADYPDNPPSIKLCTRINHPCVFNDKICLDMLEKRSAGKKIERFRGWSSSYTVQTIMMQIQAFLFESTLSQALKNIKDPKEYENEKKKFLGSVKWSVQQSRAYMDKAVGHFPPNKIWPPILQTGKQKLGGLQLYQSELRCFYSRKSYLEDVLGIGVRYSKNLKNGDIKTIKCTFDLLSLGSFNNDNLRLSAENVKFSHFLPVYINEEHGRRAMHIFERSISIIMTGNHSNFQYKMAVHVLGKLMSQCVVEVVTGRSHASIKFLQVYFWLHRLFLASLKKYPSILTEIDSKIAEYKNNEKKRHKDFCPDHGEFLALSGLSSFKWSQIIEVFLEESFVRHVFWQLIKYPELENIPQFTPLTVNKFNDDDRIDYSFKVVKASLKLILFHKFFNEKIAKPTEDLSAICDAYDKEFGRVPHTIEESFLKFFKAVNGIESYDDFFVLMGMKIEKQKLIEILKKSITKSREKGYHGKPFEILTPLEYSRENKSFSLDKIIKSDDGKGNIELIDNEEMYSKMCVKKWGFKRLPDYLVGEISPYRKLFLQHNLQDLVNRLNEIADFKIFFKMLHVSKEICRLEISMFKPTNLKSRYYFLTCILRKLENLTMCVIKKGDGGLGIKGFKSLLKGLEVNNGKLETLVLSYCDLTSQSIEELTKKKIVSSNLKNLNLSGNRIGDQGAVILSNFLLNHENLPNLTELDLSCCEISDRGARALAEAIIVKRKLKILILFRNPISVAVSNVVQALSYSTDIENLDISRIGSLRFSDSGRNNLDQLIRLTVSLKKINFWKSNLQQTPFNYSIFRELRENTTIKFLDLGSSKFKQMKELGYSLSKNKTIEKIVLSENGITGELLNQFYEEIVKKPPPNQKYQPCLNVVHLDFSGNRFDMSLGLNYKNSEALGKLIKVSKRLEYLDVSRCQLDRKQINFLNTPLKENKTIHTLLLKKNLIGKNGLKPIVEGLSCNTSIKLLDLSGNGLGVVGASYLSQIIGNNRTIESLNLFGNFIEIEGMQIFSKMLEKNNTLRKIDLGLCRIKHGVESLVNVFRKNQSLEEVLLKDNHIGDKSGIKVILSIIENRDTKIRKLFLGKNNLTKDVIHDLSLKLKKRFGEDLFKFDLDLLIKNKDPEKLERTVYVTPLSEDVNEFQLKKFFYNNSCGMIISVSIHSHRRAVEWNKRKYAFVEFATKDSVTKAIRLCRGWGTNYLNNQKISILRAGIENVGFSPKRKFLVKKGNQVKTRWGGKTRGTGRGGRRVVKTRSSRSLTPKVPTVTSLQHAMELFDFSKKESRKRTLPEFEEETKTPPLKKQKTDNDVDMENEFSTQTKDKMDTSDE